MAEKYTNQVAEAVAPATGERVLDVGWARVVESGSCRPRRPGRPHVDDAVTMALEVGPLSRALADQPDDIRARASGAAKIFVSHNNSC
jgi:hypothetical protein